MIRTTLMAIILGVLMVPLTSVSHASPPSAAVQQLIATDKRMQRAFVDRDLATLKRVFTDDYVLVAPDGAETTKAEIIAEMQSGTVIWEVNETRDWEVRAHGDLGIVVATLHTKGTNNGKPFDREVKFSDTYIREGGEWRNIHAHTCVSKHLNGT